MQPYKGKPWLCVQDQLTLLKQRGLIIDDDAQAESFLLRLGYYRFSGYAYPLRQRAIGQSCPFDVTIPNPTKEQQKNLFKPRYEVYDHFAPHARFEHVAQLYVFDKKLRLLILDALERIEISIRSQIAYQLGQQDPLAYLKPEMFHHTFTDFGVKASISQHHKWLTEQARLLERSKEDFIEHHRQKGVLPVPIWVACEVWDFGTTTTLYHGLKEADQDAISIKYGLQNGRIFGKWLSLLKHLRNICAHHGRLWNRGFDAPELLPSHALGWVKYFEQYPETKTRIFLVLCICTHLLVHLSPKSHWSERVIELINNEMPDLTRFDLGLYSMGMRSEWATILEQIKNP
jgi:abortive infection bacteriophage resistance protein